MLSTSLLHQDLQKQLTTFGRGKKMKKYLGVILVLTTMILNILVKSYVGIGVNGVLIFLGIIALIKGFKLEEIVENGYLSGKKSLLVIKIFLLVGGISSIWIMSGAIPFVLSGILYVLCNSGSNEIVKNIAMLDLLEKNFNLTYLNFLPIVIILVLTLLKVNVKISLILSIVMAMILSYFIQGREIVDIVRTLFLGFFLERDNPLYPILKGGGILSMWKTAIIIFISCCLSGLIQMLKIFSKIEEIILKSKSEFSLFIWTVIVSIIAGMLGCNQSIAVVMTIDIMKKIYEIKKISREKFAIDIENSAIVLAAGIPWNLASLFPATVMELPSLKYLAYSYFIFLVPIVRIIEKKIYKK